MSADKILAQLDLAATEPGIWSLEVDRTLCIGPAGAKHMSGGACTAALIDAAEKMTSKPLIQAGIQFFQAPAAGDPVTIKRLGHKPGRSVDIAIVQMSVGDSVCAHMTGSFGRRNGDDPIQWTRPPDLPGPGDCEPLPFIRADAHDLHTFLDVRMAGAPQNGQLNFWVRAPRDGLSTQARFLALIADYLPEALHFNLGRSVGAVSLDNCISILGEGPAEWVLCQVALDGIRNGIFHGSVKIFAEHGTLLARGSQSGLVRPRVP
ncbi:MAG: thioesterase family protein [Pseudomonadota bacterium]